MRTEQKTNTKNSIGRATVFVILLLIQLGFIAAVYFHWENKYGYLSEITILIGFMVELGIFGRHMNAGIKMPWMIFIMIFPLAGIVMYLLMGTRNSSKKMRQRYEEVDSRLFPHLKQKEETLKSLSENVSDAYGIGYYLYNSCSYPIYDDTKVTFYDDSVPALKEQIRCLKQAEKFIFMEYHAVEDVEFFQEIKDILAEKASQGVDVRFFYDDIGSIGFVDPSFIKRMEERGIKCRVFNPMAPILNIFMNNRDHRKITVIDGKVGFTGGFNLANEYFHITTPHGYWKDTGIKLEGSAVNNYTVLFLEMWNAIKRETLIDTDIKKFLIPHTGSNPEYGYVQPYGDSPLDEEHIGENVYLDIINQAEKYVYICTPYLIITDEMTRAMTLAARKGVEVKIITPGIPDKKTVYAMTRSYYRHLVLKGVRIFEYTPGFSHAKMCLSDDRIATVGTMNFDYRSFYLHFENGCYMVNVPCIKDIKADFEKMFSQSKEVELKWIESRGIRTRIWQCILRLFAPML
ncbi:MAG: cardiolipin synthase [Lachnospiraceae bacterium]|nr:cardiolipin synthase [Lachnospiraceae bacterium]